MQTAKIQWAPKVDVEQIWQVYQREAQGILDDDLLNELAWALYQRCESILMVTEGRRMPCPLCQTIITCPEEHWSRRTPMFCPTCGWTTTYGQYRDSWRHQDLHGGNAVYAFQAYVDRYPHTTSPRQRMLLIDHLIHAFHWSLKRDRPHGPAAVQLVAGDRDTVVAFLDRLTYGSGTPGRSGAPASDQDVDMQRLQYIQHSAAGRRTK